MRALAVVACLIAAAPSVARAQGFVGRTWLSTDASAPPGTLRIFLADGTLLMDSCGETYRLAKWRSLGAGRIEWTEDGARIFRKTRPYLFHRHVFNVDDFQRLHLRPPTHRPS